MFDLDNLETGTVPLLFPEPEEFRWVRPLLYGCVRQGPGEWAVSGQRAGAVLCNTM